MSRVKGSVPGPNSQRLMEERKKYVPEGVFNVTPLFAQKASGALLTDVDGNEFIDFAGGIGVLNVGSCPPSVVKAVKEQAEKFLHTCFHVVMYEGYVNVAKEVIGICPGDFPKKAMLANSGAEAVENAIKIARKARQRQAVVTFENAFHGRTLLAMALTSKVKPYKWGFGPFAPEVYRVPYAYCYRCHFGHSYPGCDMECVRYIDKALNVDIGTENVACMIAEPVQGEGGFIIPPAEFIQGLREICDKYGIIYVDDEVQSGFGRTGKMLAIENYGVVPDIVTMAKSIAAGLPLSAVVSRAEYMDAVHAGGIGGTYGGNPLACAAAMAVFEMIREQDLVNRAAAMGSKIGQRLNAMKDRFPVMGDIRGMGAMWAVEFVKDPTTKEPAKEISASVIANCTAAGLIVMKAGILDNVVRFLPPLTIEDSLLDEGLDIFEKAVMQAVK